MSEKALKNSLAGIKTYYYSNNYKLDKSSNDQHDAADGNCYPYPYSIEC